MATTTSNVEAHHALSAPASQPAPTLRRFAGGRDIQGAVIVLVVIFILFALIAFVFADSLESAMMWIGMLTVGIWPMVVMAILLQRSDVVDVDESTRRAHAVSKRFLHDRMVADIGPEDIRCVLIHEHGDEGGEFFIPMIRLGNRREFHIGARGDLVQAEAAALQFCASMQMAARITRIDASGREVESFG